MDDMLKEFLVEALDLAKQVEDNLLVLERHPDDMQTINAVFRAFHTIKGGAGFMNLQAMVTACHLTENLFDALRNGKAPVTPDAIEASLQASSFVTFQLSELLNGTSPDDLPPLPEDIESILTIAIAGETGGAAHEPSREKDDSSGPDWAALYLAITPEGTKIALHEEASEDTEDFQLEQEAKPTGSSVERKGSGTGGWDGVERRRNPSNAQVDDSIRIDAVKLEQEAKPAGSNAERKGSDTGGWDGVDRRRNTSDDSIRIDAVKLEQLLEVAGEAVQAANQASVLLEKLLQFKFDDAASDIISHLIETQARAARYSTELQRATLSTRMQPVGRLFQRFPRLVRELAKDLGKNVDLVIEGAETEVDRVVVDSLYDPLVHMLRNSLDHGVETPDGRRIAGKPERAVISLRAWQESSSVMIEISDDGRGMDPQKLRERAIARGLIETNAAQTAEEAFQLIFLPGFSTVEVASNLSGRGVGMDVVKTAVEKHRGAIWIASEIDVGTRFSIRLPIELSIVPTMMVSTSGASLALPLAMVQRVVQLPDTFAEVGGQPVFRDQGVPLPVLSLAGVLGYEPCRETAGIVIAAPSPYIIAVEALDGTADLVIKPLTALEVNGISGTARSAEGKLVLVVDLKFLLDGCRAAQPPAMIA